MPVNTELARPETEDDFEAMCCMLYQRVYHDPGLMRVGGAGQAQFGVDLLGVDRRMPGGLSVGLQCKHYVKKRFTLATVTDDVDEADKAKLAIEHLTFATTAPPSAEIVRKVHELSEQRRKNGRFTVSVEYWNTIQAHVRTFPEVGRAYIPGFPGGTLLDVRDNVLKVITLMEEQSSSSQRNFDSLQRSITTIMNDIDGKTIDGPDIAKSWADLVDGSILAPINVNESKVAVGQFDVWTGTSTNGTSLEVDCAGWLTSNGFPDTGYEGRNNATNGNWTNTGLINGSVCSTKQRLYCFQQ